MASNLSTNSSQLGQGGQKGFCIPYKPIGSRALWLKPNPLDNPYPIMMAQIILIGVTSRLLYSLLRPLGQTKFVCKILAGIIWGPSVLGHKQAIKDLLVIEGKDFPLFETICNLAIIYSLFVIGVKFDLDCVRRRVKNALKIGLPGIFFPLAVSFTIRPITNNIPGFPNSGLFLFSSGFTFSSCFFSVIAEALDELNLMTSELGQIAMSCGMLNDIFTYLALAMAFVYGKDTYTHHEFVAFLSFVSMICFIIFLMRPLLKLIAETKGTMDGEVKESYVVAILVLVLVLAFVSDAVGTRSSVGPLLLGLVMPNGPPLGATIVKKTEFLVSEFLLPVFFFRVGFQTNVYSIRNWINVTKVEVYHVVTFVTKIVATTVAGLFCKIRFKNSLILSLILSIKGFVELYTYNLWKIRKNLDEESFTHIVLTTLALTMMVTPVVYFSYKPQLGVRQSVKNMQSVSSDSEMLRVLCCVHNEESVRNIIALLEASNPTEASPIFSYVIHLVELIGRAAPLLVPIKKRNTNSRTDQMMQAFENYLKNSRGPVLIQAYTMVAPYRSMHETICRLANEKDIALVIIPFHENHQRLVGPSTITASIHHFNANVQLYSSCTVGILVDRGLSFRFSLNRTQFSCSVGVVFIGGPDDREALAYARRMSGNPEIIISVFRFILKNKTKGNELEKEAKLDEALVDEFKLRNIGNHCFHWRDIEVEDDVHVLDGIRKLQGNYDLVMVGRRHKEMWFRVEEMEMFLDHVELGVVGDMLASSDFCGGTVNVLVMQESRKLGGVVEPGATIRGSERGLSLVQV